MVKDPRTVRTRAVWLLVLPFFWFAQPTLTLVAYGGGLAALGLAIRAWAAGAIRKDRELTTTGPYAYTRNPLYVGSFFIGLGVTTAGAHVLWTVVFLVFYLAVYGRTLAYEAEVLTELFGDEFRAYAAAVPAVVPRLTPYPGTPAGGAPAPGFTLSQYLRNKEWEALLGATAAFALLTAKAVFLH